MKKFILFLFALCIIAIAIVIIRDDSMGNNADIEDTYHNFEQQAMQIEREAIQAKFKLVILSSAFFDDTGSRVMWERQAAWVDTLSKRFTELVTEFNTIPPETGGINDIGKLLLWSSYQDRAPVDVSDDLTQIADDFFVDTMSIANVYYYYLVLDHLEAIRYNLPVQIEGEYHKEAAFP